MIYAVQQGGLDAAERFSGGRRAAVFWGAFYGLFVVAVSIHGAIGLRNIARNGGHRASAARLDAVCT